MKCHRDGLTKLRSRETRLSYIRSDTEGLEGLMVERG